MFLLFYYDKGSFQNLDRKCSYTFFLRTREYFQFSLIYSSDPKFEIKFRKLSLFLVFQFQLNTEKYKTQPYWPIVYIKSPLNRVRAGDLLPTNRVLHYKHSY